MSTSSLLPRCPWYGHFMSTAAIANRVGAGGKGGNWRLGKSRSKPRSGDQKTRARTSVRGMCCSGLADG
jgi:hypothetical protein